MTTSATGICGNRTAGQRAQRIVRRVGKHPRIAAGFTLLEMLVVVAIIGIVMSMAVLSIGGDSRAEELERESRQFAELLRLGGEQAVLRGEEWAVQIEPDAFRFLVYTDDGWRLLEDDDMFRARKWAEDTVFELELEGREVEIETADEPKPTLILYSSGEVSPFTAFFAAEATPARYRVTANFAGDIEWKTVDER